MANVYEQFCDGRFPLPEEAQVANLEKRLEIRLPGEYRRFLLEYNGGTFMDPEIVSHNERCPIDGLTFLSGIGATNPTFELASSNWMSIFTENNPVIILPIGYTIMGNMIILKTSKKFNGQILLKTFGEYFILANGIREFFDLIREPTD